MLVEQRYKRILEQMQGEGSVKASRLKELLEVSSETIRRDLECMEAQGLLRRTHGGAVLPQYSEIKSSAAYIPFVQRGNENREGKRQIALLASTYIQEGQSIALDSGTTAFEMARVIKSRFNSLTVVTNSLVIANELSGAHGVTLVLTGGVYRPDEAAFASDIATLIFSRLRINTFFLTTCGISAECGVTYQRMDEIIVQDKMMEASDKTICIADSSKLGLNSLVRMCDISHISMIITDSQVQDSQILPFVRAGVPVIKP